MTSIRTILIAWMAGCTAVGAPLGAAVQVPAPVPAPAPAPVPLPTPAPAPQSRPTETAGVGELEDLGTVVGDLGARAVKAVEAFLDTDVRDDIEFRVATVPELRKILDRELAPQFAVQFSEADEAAAQRRRYVANFAKAIFAKYEFGTPNVLVLPETLANVAASLDLPNLDTKEVLQAILVHEVVHVLADTRHKFSTRLLDCKSTDELLSYNAVIEGHAQFVARRVCAAEGWLGGFELFTKSIGMVPKGLDPVRQLILRSAVVANSWAYYDGETFIRAIHDAKGDEGIALAYAEPPLAPDIVFHPEWYLDPSLRPKRTANLDRPLKLFASKYDKDEWMQNRVTLTPVQITTVLDALPGNDVQRVNAHMTANRMAVLNTKNPPGARSLTAGIFEFDAALEAMHFFACEERIMRSKDETLRTGPVHIVSSEYEHRVAPGTRGLIARKSVQTTAGLVPTISVVLVRGVCVLEVSFNNYEIEIEDAYAIATETLDAVFAGD